MSRDSRGRFTSGAAVAQELKQGLGDIVIELTLETGARIREATPIDTGNAAAQWFESMGVPVLDQASSVEESRARGAQAQTALLSYQPAMGNTYVANPTDYIEFLNGGSSTQAPEGFIEREAAIAQDIIRDRHAGKEEI